MLEFTKTLQELCLKQNEQKLGLALKQRLH